MLRTVDVVNVSGVLLVATAASTARTCLVLIDLPATVVVLSVDSVAAADRASRSVMMLAVDEGHSLNTILLIVIAVFVASLDQLLLGFLKAKRANKSITIVGDVDVGHITGVIYARLSLQMMRTLNIDKMSTSLPMVINLVLHRLLIMTPVDGILTSITVKILLAWYRLKRVLLGQDRDT